ncbi:MAG: glycosyltransferase, partial [Verrucomicrobiota bacterium]|nr:glycosyltransferase [Verrucomicrobiota bacterium]
MHRSLSPLVSVVIPTKNSLPHLKNAIEGLRRQTYQHFELIIQDGGSTDGTLEYLANIHDLPSIDIQSQIDSGLGQAYNRGIARCRGDYLFLTASDERLFDHTLEKLLEWFKEYPSAAVIYGGALLVDSQGKEVS